ncbi:NAD(+)/NADH kinase [[Eubacterium] cellulosolvens]
MSFLNLPCKKSMKVGFLINPYAGTGIRNQKNVINQIIRYFPKAKFVTSNGLLGLNWIPKNKVVEIVKIDYMNTRKDTVSVIQKILDRTIDLLLIVGGDGTLADVARAVYVKQSQIPIIGIGLGSANVGDLISIRKDVLKKPKVILYPKKVNALAASYEGKLVGLSFNDIVIGNTIVTTVNGRTTQIDIMKKRKGVILEKKPKPIGRKDTYIKIIGRNKKKLMIKDRTFGTIVASKVDRRYIGKAITGALNEISCKSIPAAISVIDKPVIMPSVTDDEYLRMEPFTTITASIPEKSKAIIGNVKTGSFLIIDGNPEIKLKRTSTVEIENIDFQFNTYKACDCA